MISEKFMYYSVAERHGQKGAKTSSPRKASSESLTTAKVKLLRQ